MKVIAKKTACIGIQLDNRKDYSWKRIWSSVHEWTRLSNVAYTLNFSVLYFF